MPHQAFSASLIITDRSRGISIGFNTSGGVLVVVDQITALPPMASIMPTGLDMNWGLNSDITADEQFEMFLSVVDVDNLPELAAIRNDNAWAGAQVWRVGTGSFTIPVQTLTTADPRFFHPKEWKNLEVGARARRLYLCFLVASLNGNSVLGTGNIRWTEMMLQRRFGNDNAYSDVNNNEEFADDYGMDIDE